MEGGNSSNSNKSNSPSRNNVEASMTTPTSSAPNNSNRTSARSSGLPPTPPSSSPIREQDRYLPIANVVRIMRGALPPHGKISDEAKETLQECVSEFISFVTEEANEKCLDDRRKTITGEDLICAMGRLGFDNYVEPLKRYLQKYRQYEANGLGRGDGASRRRHAHRSPGIEIPGSSVDNQATAGVGVMPPLPMTTPQPLDNQDYNYHGHDHGSDMNVGFGFTGDIGGGHGSNPSSGGNVDDGLGGLDALQGVSTPTTGYDSDTSFFDLLNAHFK